ncbi:MAG: hypothetical protein KKF56_01065 [Nanoarchaeota archaeon]|nr:hypothetical protein [Nanoarchaeota archaeon]
MRIRELNEESDFSVGWKAFKEIAMPVTGDIRHVRNTRARRDAGEIPLICYPCAVVGPLLLKYTLYAIPVAIAAKLIL